MSKEDILINNLIQGLMSLRGQEEFRIALGDICSYDELMVMSERLEAARLLSENTLMSDIAAQLNISANTVANIKNILSQPDNGFDILLRSKNESKSYSSFASIYDSLTVDVDYKERVEYIKKLFDKYAKLAPKLVLDLACGTGNITKLMMEQGHDMIGIDASVDMLSVAREKINNKDVLLINQQMEDFELYGTVDAVICLLDSINYLTRMSDLKRCFKLVENYLNPDGLFIFDINTRYKLEHTLAGSVFTGEDEAKTIFYTWENTYDAKDKICQFDLNFFVRENETCYSRFNEVHYQYAYSDKQIKNALASVGLELVTVYDDLTFYEPKCDAQKVFYIARKVNR